MKPIEEIKVFISCGTRICLAISRSWLSRETGVRAFEDIPNQLNYPDTKLAMALPFHPGLEEKEWAFAIGHH